jgi:hypothetical protein
MLVSHDKNAGQNQDMKIGNRSFENVSQFKYLGTRVTNQNLIQEEIKRDCILKCMLPFGPEPFVLSPAVEKCKC